MMIISATNRAKTALVFVKKYVKQNKQRSIALAFAVLIGLGGLLAMQLSNAATFVVALEAEAGNVSGLASKTSTGTNSSGGFVKFGEGTNPTPTPTPPTPTPPTPNPTPSSRASGLPWSSGVWGKENAGYASQFVAGARGGVPLDNIMQYTWRDSHATQISSVAAIGTPDMVSGFNGARDDFILSVTTWAIDGSYMNASQAGQIGTAACKVDSTPIVRLNWEMNLPGGPGHNGEQLTSSNYSSWVARFRTAATSMKSACPGLKVDFNPNHGADQTSGCAGALANSCSRRAFAELKDVIDIYGIDTYDAWAGHDVQLSELNEAYAFAQANGKKFSIPEWGVATGSYGNGHGDDASYINMIMDWCNSHASGMAYETYFSEPAGYIVSDLVGSNPNARAAMAAKIKQYSSKY